MPSSKHLFEAKGHNSANGLQTRQGLPIIQGHRVSVQAGLYQLFR